MRSSTAWPPRTGQRANVNAQADARAAFEAAGARLAALASEREALAGARTQLEAEWADNPLAAEAPVDDAGQRAAWLSAQQAALRTAFDALDGREAMLRRAVLARDAAQQAWDQAHREHEQLLASAGKAQTTLGKLDADIAALAARREAAATALAEVLSELDPVLAPLPAALPAVLPAALPTDGGGEAWQTHWRRDPAAWRLARADEARQWNDQAARQTRLQGALGTLDAERAALAARVEQTGGRLLAAQAEFARRDAELTARRRERAGLFDGRAAREVETALAGSVSAARAAHGAGQAASLQAAQAEARVRATQAQVAGRIADLQGELARAGERLAQWIQAFAGNDRGVDSSGSVDSVDNEQQLAALLQVGTAWMAQERGALHELDAAARQAAAVLAERRAQGQQHAQQQAQDDDSGADVADVAAALQAAQAERAVAHETAAALALRLREDDGRRERARSMMAEIERQRAIEERWAKLSELIGSADGKKFRNYAQQFTLDVLLGYANTHLAQLARRYRLERVMSNAGPSLALVVRDQDMGGEIRSVNSLSGGESFLVSLALALGLASLSSNRVKVESLFIDEGFGSLDSDTLGVAMDALDALQSMGRKVGVISHVQEMTERIATKVMVRPAGGGSSAVTVQ
jgi:exonuclease SbcC